MTGISISASSLRSRMRQRAGRDVTVTTFVKTHNLLGRAYLAAVMPFHKIIVPAMLGRVNGAR